MNAISERFGSALQAASLRGHKKVAQTLLENDADVNSGSGMFGSALQAASQECHGAVVQMLLEKGAKFIPGLRTLRKAQLASQIL